MLFCLFVCLFFFIFELVVINNENMAQERREAAGNSAEMLLALLTHSDELRRGRSIQAASVRLVVFDEVSDNKARFGLQRMYELNMESF